MATRGPTLDQVHRLRSGTLAAWAGAWLAGRAAADEVVAAVTGSDAPHRVIELPGETGPVPLSQLLIHWRRCGASSVRLLLAVAGDVRGVPGPDAFRHAALAAGEAVHGGGLGVVPEVIDHFPSSAPTTVLWRAFEVGAAPRDDLFVSECAAELRAAIRETAGALAAAEVAGGPADLADSLASARRAGERLELPPAHPAPAVALLAQAERLAAVLDVAARDPLGGAIERHGAQRRIEALRPLALAVRRARIAGYNANATGSGDSAGTAGPTVADVG